MATASTVGFALPIRTSDGSLFRAPYSFWSTCGTLLDVADVCGEGEVPVTCGQAALKTLERFSQVASLPASIRDEGSKFPLSIVALADGTDGSPAAAERCKLLLTDEVVRFFQDDPDWNTPLVCEAAEYLNMPLFSAAAQAYLATEAVKCNRAEGMAPLLKNFVDSL